MLVIFVHGIQKLICIDYGIETMYRLYTQVIELEKNLMFFDLRNENIEYLAMRLE